VSVWQGDPWIDWIDLVWAGNVPPDAEVLAANPELGVRELAIRYGYRQLDAPAWPEDISATVTDTSTLPVDVGSIVAGIRSRRRSLSG
jgi:hypothetical protein